MKAPPRMKNGWAYRLAEETAGPAVPDGAFTVVEFMQEMARRGEKYNLSKAQRYLRGLVLSGKYRRASRPTPEGSGAVYVYWPVNDATQKESGK